MPKMGLKKLKICTFWSASIWVFVALSFLVNMVQCQDVNDYDQVDNPAVLPFVTSLVNSRLSNLTNVLSKDISDQASFCIKDQEAEWNKAFNFSSNLDFLASCIQQTQGSIMRRVCTAAEAKFYFDMFFKSSNANALRPNKNCNLTSWVSGCEPGWACLSGYNELVNNNNSIVIPSRTSDCQPCCAGFFCPRGLTCMLPCPLGSHCPKATQDNQTGLCEPYSYQLPPGHPNHTCGGANIWVDIRNNSEIFCPAGSYCPTTVQKELCRNGHYCRTGSTSQKPCIKLTSCNSNTATQDLQVYGIFLLVATVTLLLIIYNCSDQVLTTRERRLAKTREAAAISARETAKARQRWKAAKNAAKKHARGLQTHISQRFSFKKAAKHPEELKILDKTRFETDEHLYAPVHMSTSSESLSSSAPSRGQPIELSNPMRVIHEIEDEPGNYDGFDVGSHDRKSKGQTTKGQRPHTHSQIFKYAYAQIEKEKAQQQDNENLTFSGVVSMATDHEMKKRHLIEISFKDLTLTLKGKEKHLLRCVTGTMKPGRITAVMGPSGAGKTTFISALAGKAMGCKKTGLILINGKNESILSYRKIIGYVPQDDIVHGNLTVEENLWFNAKCRLPAHLPKPDKVLVLERVIESLGLQTVRDSLVGTVEKRGISGGQRKRVNVGLEMVMEPSLLILDEPTSGLDSASSLQLLRALRREALEGVNICMVLHQPSYSLFQMFDDLVLLAKGGLTVYHGSAKKAEQYFAGLGIHVPDHVNPPDHFIDVLEGIVKPSQSSDVNYLELPVRWMLHNGYQVPPDLQQTAARIAMSSASPAPTNGTSPRAGIEEKSFAGELWQDVMSKVEIYRDSIRHNFLKSKDLSRRRTPGVLWQYRYFLGRLCKQRMRESKEQAIDYLILLLAGLCLGTIAKTDEVNFGAAGYTYTIIAVSLLCQIAALRSFSLDKLQYWRESASGMSSLAYFLAKDTVDHFNTVIKPVVYLSMYFFITNPRSTFTENYTVLLCLVYCVTGMGYAFAIFFQPGPAQLWSALVPVVLTLVASQTQDSEVMKKISNLCYPKWALEAFVIANAERYYGVWLITRCATLKKTGYSLDEWALCIVILILTGVICRSIAYLVMITSKKK